MKDQDGQGEGSKDMESGEVFGEVWKYCMVLWDSIDTAGYVQNEGFPSRKPPVAV